MDGLDGLWVIYRYGFADLCFSVSNHCSLCSLFGQYVCFHTGWYQNKQFLAKKKKKSSVAFILKIFETYGFGAFTTLFVSEILFILIWLVWSVGQDLRV